jgi:hypothetical protein
MAKNLRHKGSGSPAARKSLKFALTSAALGAVALFSASGSAPARAADFDDYRWDHVRADCRVVETRSTNRWGEDVTTHRRVCD